MQPKQPIPAALLLSSWMGDVMLEELTFGAGPPRGVVLGGASWQGWADAFAPSGGFAVLLPHAEGIQVQAMLPRPAAKRLSGRYKCSVWHPQ
mmetsp:Transcript_16022/g.36202  ORF Transcript_16022/g.36202 Transcript_16022/m.36202 type:complete len:92 (+) Transcript_16022:2-277(+)